MSYNEEKAMRLKASVEWHFASTKLPIKDRITECDCWECLELRERMSKMSERELDAKTLKSNLTLSLLSPEAFLFFLPAYVLFSIDNPRDESGIYEHTVNVLTPGKDDDISATFYSLRLRLFTKEQFQVILEFLNWVASDPESFLFYTNIDRGRPRLSRYFDMSRSNQS